MTYKELINTKNKAVVRKDCPYAPGLMNWSVTSKSIPAGLIK